MSNTPVRRVSPKDIQVVQNLIERCLQLYMNREEVVQTLLAQAKIEPGFTELVWQKLEEENQEFFKAYYLRLLVKSQINQFNKLLEQQVRLTRQINQTGVNNMASSNGSHLSPLHHNLACYAPEHAGSTIKSESLHHSLGSNLPNAFTNGGSSLHPTLHPAVEISSHVNNRIDPSPNMLSSSTQNTNMGMIQGINGGIIKSETGYSGASPYVFADGGILEARASLQDGSVASFSSVESSTQTLNEPLLEPETSFGFLNQIPRNFSLSDLTADFSQSTEILENYSKSSYLVTDNENFLEREREHQADNKRLDTISEGMSYDEFGSE